MAQSKKSSDSIIKEINDHKFENLDVYLKDKVEWENFGDELIVPKNARKFIKSIQDKETRIAVANFLQKYARQYFREAAERQEYNEKAQNMFSVGVPDMPVKTADARVTLLQQELLFILDQEQSTGEFSGDKFNKQDKKIKELEKQVNELMTINQQLQARINRFEHPEKYGKFIPPELNNSQFRVLMQYLQSKRIVFPIFVENTYGHVIQCYRWHGSKALFGYYVEQLNVEFELNEAREQRNWQIFEPVFENYDEIVEEARKAVSKYRKDSNTLLPAGADYVKNAIKEANKKDDSSK